MRFLTGFLPILLITFLARFAVAGEVRTGAFGTSIASASALNISCYDIDNPHKIVSVSTGTLIENGRMVLFSAHAVLVLNRWSASKCLAVPAEHVADSAPRVFGLMFNLENPLAHYCGEYFRNHELGSTRASEKFDYSVAFGHDCMIAPLNEDLVARGDLKVKPAKLRTASVEDYLNWPSSDRQNLVGNWLWRGPGQSEKSGFPILRDGCKDLAVGMNAEELLNYEFTPGFLLPVDCDIEFGQSGTGIGKIEGEEFVISLIARGGPGAAPAVSPFIENSKAMLLEPFVAKLLAEQIAWASTLATTTLDRLPLVTLETPRLNFK